MISGDCYQGLLLIKSLSDKVVSIFGAVALCQIFLPSATFCCDVFNASR